MDVKEQAINRLEEEIAFFFERFGFRRNLGRIWARLFLSEAALSQHDLAERLALSTGLVSSGIKELIHFGMIKSVTCKGERRAYYQAETRLLYVAHSILRKRELPAVERLGDAARTLKEILNHDQLCNRLETIEDAVELYMAFAKLLLTICQFPHSAMQRVIKFISSFRPLHDVNEESSVSA